MKTPPFVFLALLLAALPTGLSGADASSPAPQGIDPKDIEAVLVPEKKTILPDEPIFVTFTVRNKSRRDLGIYEGCSEYFDDPRNPDFYFKLTATDAQGRALPLIPTIGPPYFIGCQRYVSKLAADGDYTVPLLLPGRVKLDKPGTYTVTVSKVVGISLPGSRVLGPEDDYTKDLLTLTMTATTTIKVLPPDSKKMGQVIDEIGAKTVSLGKKFDEDQIVKDWFHGGKKADDSYSWLEKLLAIHDERTIPWLLRIVLTTHNCEAREQAICALALSRSDAAFDALKTAMATPPGKIVYAPYPDGPGSTPALSAAEFRMDVLDAIAASRRAGHASAIEFTMNYRHDPDPGLRGVVLSLASDMKPEESVPFLLEFTKDSDRHVSLAAKEDLCRACRQIAPQEAMPILHDLAADSDRQLTSDVKGALEETQKKLDAQSSPPR